MSAPTAISTVNDMTISPSPVSRLDSPPTSATATSSFRGSRSGQKFTLAALTLLPIAITACGNDGDEAKATLRAPMDGATVAGGFDVEMVADGVTIEEAGEARQGFGHFHLIVDDGCVEAGTAIPSDAAHVHFGTGSGTGWIYLEPGEHELCLQVGDGEHSALDITDTATVTVAIRTIDEWCAVIRETDEMFTEADTGGMDFDVSRVTYGNVGRLLAQLTSGLDVVDGDARDTVAEAIEFGSAIAAAPANAVDEAARDAALDDVWREYGDAGEEAMAEAAIWIREECGVHIDG